MSYFTISHLAEAFILPVPPYSPMESQANETKTIDLNDQVYSQWYKSIIILVLPS